MLNKIYNLYQYIKPEDRTDNPYGLDFNTKFVNAIVLSFDKNLKFKNIIAEEYDIEKNKQKYLFQRIVGSTFPYFPSVSYNTGNAKGKVQKDPEENSVKRIMKSLDKHRSSNKEIDNLYSEIENQLPNIVSMLKERQKKERNILTIKIGNDYVANSPFLKFLVDSYVSQEQVTDGLHKGVCAFCNKQKMVQSFEDSDFKFYGKSELSCITGLSVNNAWRNFPICNECISKFKVSKQFAWDYMIYNFAGMYCFLLPNFITENFKTNQQVLYNFKDLNKKAEDFTLKNNVPKVADHKQKVIFNYLKNENTIVNYSIYFFKRDSSKFTILTSLEGIYPYVFENIQKIENQTKEKFSGNMLYIDKKLTPINDISYILNLIKDFCSSKSFKHKLEILQKVFMNKPIDSQTMFKGFNKHIKDIVVQSNSSNFDREAKNIINKAEILSYYFHNLKILK